jgi:hypothetical protein
MTKQAQSKRILRDLLRGWKITPLQALKRYGCLRLGARIHLLRKQGYPIQAKMVDVGDGKRVAQYWLPKQKVAA